MDLAYIVNLGPYDNIYLIYIQIKESRISDISTVIKDWEKGKASVANTIPRQNEVRTKFDGEANIPVV